MEYHAGFKDSDLRRDVKSHLEKKLSQIEFHKLPPLTPEEINDYIEQAMEDTKNQGNSALYHGLILYATNIALDKILTKTA